MVRSAYKLCVNASGTSLNAMPGELLCCWGYNVTRGPSFMQCKHLVLHAIDACTFC